jgi:hypothetical protein
MRMARHGAAKAGLRREPNHTSGDIKRGICSSTATLFKSPMAHTGLTPSPETPSPAPPSTAGGEIRPVLKSLRKRKGRVTLGDVMADTGFSQDETESTLRGLLSSRQGHMEVGESGTLVYRFEPGLIQWDAEPLSTRLARGAWALFKKAFKVWIVLMLVVYFVVFVALLIAALVASQSREGGRGGGRRIGGRHRGGFGGFPSFWFWYLFWTPDWRWGRPYYGNRWERRYGSKGGKPKVPFLVKVFSFVFGPDRPKPTRLQKNRSVIRLIRARRGVLTATELVQHSGLTLQEAEEEMARLMVEHGGDVKVTNDGVLTYIFPELMVSAQGRVQEREPDPAWRRLEPDESVTGNDKKSNAIIGGINGFNFVAAATAPLYIFPRLGLSGDLAWIGLVWVPMIFSALFFAIPLARTLLVRRRNAARLQRNLRRVLLGPVFQASLVGDGAQRVRLSSAKKRAAKALPAAVGGNGAVAHEFQRLLAEFDGDVEETPDGDVDYRFPTIRTGFLGAEKMRRRLTLEKQEVGDIVYASDDTEEEANQRELEAFDREMAREKDLERYLQNPDRVDYLDDFELVAFDEELGRGQALQA